MTRYRYQFARFILCLACFGALITASTALAAHDLYTVADTNVLMRVADPTTGAPFAAVPIGVTQDTPAGPVRKIRGLAYDDARGVMYGLTREGQIVCVDLTTATTNLITTLPVAMNPPNSFWGGFAYDGAALYTANAFGNQQFVKVPIVTNGANPCGIAAGTPVLLGSMHLSGGFQPQILGLDFYPSTAPPPGGANPQYGLLYGANRNNDDIVLIGMNASVTFIPPNFNQTMDVNNVQEIAFHPTTGVLYSIHDHSSVSNNAALASYNFATGFATELGELPFGIVESVGGGNDTYGWGGLAFAPAVTCPAPVCPPASSPTSYRVYRLSGNPNGTPWSWRISGPSLTSDVCQLNVPGVQPGSCVVCGSTVSDVRCVAQAFEASIDGLAASLGCSTSQLDASMSCVLLPANLAFPTGCSPSLPNSVLLTIRVGDPLASSPTSPTWTLFVGPAGSVAGCAVNNCTNGCGFNPTIVEIPLSGNDCNDNGIDDILDLLQGTSVDANGDDVPDECSGSPCGPSSGSCFKAHKLPGCDVVPCCESTCELDPFCCDVQWDQACAELAGAFCVPPIPGDLNGDSSVNGQDLGILLGSWGTPNADLNGDKTTDGSDLAILLGSWGKGG